MKKAASTDQRLGADLDHNGGDYRASHLIKGASYDKTLEEHPFDAYMSRREDEVLASLVPRLFPRGVPRYLDFACGTGRALSRVAQYAQESVGVDVSPTMLDQARQKCPGAKLVQLDLTVTDKDFGEFDLITTFRFIGNAQDTLRNSALAALTRRLKPGGYLVLDSHRNPRSLRNLLHPGTAEGQDLHLAKLRGLLTRHGVAVQQTIGIGWWIAFDSQNSQKVLTSRLARVLDAVQVGRTPLVRFCPDVVVVARKPL
jgi:SAM-dependent methyltransferase